MLQTPGRASPPCNCLQSPTALRNIIGRFVVTTIYCSLLTLLGCALPFFGSFLALVSLAAARCMD